MGSNLEMQFVTPWGDQRQTLLGSIAGRGFHTPWYGGKCHKWRKKAFNELLLRMTAFSSTSFWERGQPSDMMVSKSISCPA